MSRRGRSPVQAFKMTHMMPPTPGKEDKKPLLAESKKSASEIFSLGADPSSWNVDVFHEDADDQLHTVRSKKDIQHTGSVFTLRGFMNVGCVTVVAACIVGVFLVYPVVTTFLKPSLGNLGAFGPGGINATGQVPVLLGGRAIIDPDTPSDAYTKTSWTGQDMNLVFSDEFNVDGRTFYPGDDPYWEAVDLHYWATNNLEWYDPAAVMTGNGSLRITMTKQETHNLSYQGGLLTTWNKFCFTGGMIETSLRLPGTMNVRGLWPAVWTMGNLGRAGYGASLEGTWPYSYDFCDVGTMPNQTKAGAPLAATTGSPDSKDNGPALSFLTGQRLSRCTCDGENHPGPKHADGSYVGRSAPEIDVIEATVQSWPGEDPDVLLGGVSQSGQFAPFNHEMTWDNSSENLLISDDSRTYLNTFTGNKYQMTTSCVSKTNQECYESPVSGAEEGCFAVYAMEYKAGYDDGYIAWVNDGQLMWRLNGAGMKEDPTVQIQARQIPAEPMYLLANLGISPNFGPIDFDKLVFPTTMELDYIRVYQPKDAYNVGCDPPEFPTASYIEQYIEAYTDADLTTWVDDYKQTVPRNSFDLGGC